MQLSESLYIVGGGANALGISQQHDSAVYLLDLKSELALIDAGCGIDPAPIESNVEQHGFALSRIKRVLLTHCHADHAGAAARWRERTGAAVLASAEEASLLERADEEALGLTIARANGVYPEDYRLTPCPVDRSLRHEDEIRVGETTISALNVPGHSPGSICYLAELDGRRCLFSGDVVFCGGWISLLNCPGSALGDYREHLPRLANLGVEALLPGHFGFTLGMGQRHINNAIGGLTDLWPPRRML
jgi:glyoxylase-like metal-dependent hydrolase (beta-lactamase superfamily II)